MQKISKSKGILLILSSPSGAGKTTISEKLLERATNLVKSVSVTTRKPRADEVNGRDYFFVTKKEFDELCRTEKMLEYAKVFDNFYGIPRDFIEQSLKQGMSILLSIDWQGAFRLFEIMREQIVSVFILPPSVEELRSRLFKRNSDSKSEIERRLIEAKYEMSKSNRYDHAVINDSIERSVEEIHAILNSARVNY